MRKTIGIGATLAVAAGAAFWAARDAGEIGSVGPLSSAEGKSRGELAAFAPTQARREFRSMAVAADETPKCAPPKPPKDIGPTALTRNSLQQILRILALRKWQETGSCECFFSEIGWDAVAQAAPEFERTDGIDLRFDLSDLREQADELEAQRQRACPE